MSANPRSTEHALFLLAAAAAATGVAAPSDLGADLWRLGGGAMVALWLAALGLVAVPLVALELALSARAGQSLPAALAERRGPWGAWLGWLLLSQAGLIAAFSLARAAWYLAPGGEAPLVAAGLGALAIGAVARPGLAGWLGGLALAALVGGAALAVRDAGGDAVLTLFTPRVEALVQPAPWASAAPAAMRSAPAGLAVLPALLAALSLRSRPAGLGLRAALLAALVALIAATGAFCLMISARDLPAPGNVGLALAVARAAEGDPAAATGLTALAPGAALAAAALATAVGRAFAHAGRERWGQSGAPAVVGVGLLLLAVGLCAAGAPGVTAAEIGVVWLCGLLAPCLALALCLSLRARDGLIELTRALDRAGGVRITRWLPQAARWVTPTALLLGLGAWGAGLAAGGLPGTAAAEGLGPLGPLTGALHTVVPALLIVGLFALSTGLSWLPGRADGGAR